MIGRRLIGVPEMNTRQRDDENDDEQEVDDDQATTLIELNRGIACKLRETARSNRRTTYARLYQRSLIDFK
jgi:hypothetical protein